jgi:hypothetical protein
MHNGVDALTTAARAVACRLFHDEIEQAFEHSQDLKDWAEQIQKRAARTLQPNTAADGNICSE